MSRPKHTQRLRVLFQNVNGLPVYNNQPKNTQLQDVLNRIDVNIFLGAESNVNWKANAYTQRLPERVRSWWEASKVMTAFSHHELDHDPHLYGDTMVLARNKAAHRISESGVDASGLGCWAWVHLKGKAGLAVQFISAFRPVQNKAGPLLVFNQHERFRLQNKRTGCPQQMFSLDLVWDLINWRDDGDLITGRVA